jgi:hypothetical protein
VHARGGADNGGEKRNVLIVSGLLPILIDLAQRSETQRGIEVLRMREQPVLLRMATAPIAFMGDAEVEDQAPAAPWSRRKFRISTSPRRWSALAVTPNPQKLATLLQQL